MADTMDPADKRYRDHRDVAHDKPLSENRTREAIRDSLDNLVMHAIVVAETRTAERIAKWIESFRNKQYPAQLAIEIRAGYWKEIP